ncbi:MAG: hypothetical protein OXI10_00665 [Gammaproteobacteria bacterium]|nr:hypothetical protein [Gammaproteobacteria bacterium]
MFQQRRPSPPPRRSREEWQCIVEEYEACTTPQEQFCAERGLSTTQLRRWRRRFILEASAGGSCDVSDSVVPAPADTLVDFLEFPMTAPKAPAQAAQPVPMPAPSGNGHWRVELDLGGGLVLRLR